MVLLIRDEDVVVGQDLNIIELGKVVHLEFPHYLTLSRDLNNPCVLGITDNRVAVL